MITTTTNMGAGWLLSLPPTPYPLHYIGGWGGFGQIALMSIVWIRLYFYSRGGQRGRHIQGRRKDLSRGGRFKC